MLNTEKDNEFIFDYEDLEIYLLGGLNDNHYDSLRVTLKVKKKDSYLSERHSVDLYNGSQVERFIRRISERLEIRVMSIRLAFIKLTDELELYRRNNMGQSTSDEAFSYKVSEEELKEAQNILTSENLLDVTNNLIGASGIIGEEKNRLLMYLIFTSRKTSDPLHCISYGSSGAGKTHLQSKVSDLIPDEDKVNITNLSANAFYYFKQHELRNKLILIEDLDGAEDGLLPLRELQTKKRITKSVVQKGIGGIGKTNNLIVEGPVCVAGCTTKTQTYEDNANRCFLIYIDESREQDERIMTYQRLMYAGKVDEDYQRESVRLLQNVQRLLKPIRVVNPFAEYLELPKSVFKPRRTNIHYLQLIEVVTFYHQNQRIEQFDEVSGEAYIETTLEDIRLANSLIKDVLLRKSDRLGGVTRDYFEILTDYLKSKGSNTFSNQEIRNEFRINETTLRRYHKKLTQEEYIIKCDTKAGQSHRYEIIDDSDFKNLQVTIEKALELCLKNFAPSQPRHT